MVARMEQEIQQLPLARMTPEEKTQYLFLNQKKTLDLLTGFIVGSATFIILAAVVMAVVYFILGSVVGVGYSRFNLDLVDRQKEPEIGILFGYFKFWKTTAAASFLQGLYVFLWSLLFIIPGIVAGYSYAMTDYILAEHPELTAGEAIEQSKAMMYGNRFRLFCLQFSFVGWDLLCALTLGIGSLWLRPYKQAAEAAFYRDISGLSLLLPPVKQLLQTDRR